MRPEAKMESSYDDEGEEEEFEKRKRRRTLNLENDTFIFNFFMNKF